MIGILYRYQNPTNGRETLYVGQGANRDQHHRRGKSSFGRRYKKRFPDIELPKPIKWEIDVANQMELNEEETIAMFVRHSWNGYDGGMNLTFPGSSAYKDMAALGSYLGGKIGGRKGGLKGGKTQGRINTENGHMARMRAKRTHEDRVETSRRVGLASAAKGEIQALGRKQGKKLVESGRWAELQKLGNAARRLSGIIKITFEQRSRGGKKSIRLMPTASKNKGRCTRWNIQRGKPCVCGLH